MYHTFFTHSSADGLLACSHVLAIENGAVVNIGMHYLLKIIVFIFYCAGSLLRMDFL